MKLFSKLEKEKKPKSNGLRNRRTK